MPYDLYTIGHITHCSGIDEDTLRFLIRAMPGGEVTTHLHQLNPGDSVELSAPFGWFRPGAFRKESAPVFFATGTGISPFISYLRSYPSSPPAMIFYGARLQKELLHQPLLDKYNTHIALPASQAHIIMGA